MNDCASSTVIPVRNPAYSLGDNINDFKSSVSFDGDVLSLSSSWIMAEVDLEAESVEDMIW